MDETLDKWVNESLRKADKQKRKTDCIALTYLKLVIIPGYKRRGQLLNDFYDAMTNEFVCSDAMSAEFEDVTTKILDTYHRF